MLRRRHIGPQHATPLDQRIILQLDPGAKAAFERLRRNVDTLACHVVLPAVIRAAQPALLVASEPERDAAVGAELVDQPEASVRVPKGQQPLREQFDADRGPFILGQLARQERRQPIAPEQIAHRRARTGLGQQLVLRSRQHGDAFSNNAYLLPATYSGSKPSKLAILETTVAIPESQCLESGDRLKA